MKMTAWGISATSGMMGADIDEEFLEGLMLEELHYLVESIKNTLASVEAEITRKVGA
jgi:hypothetical protein